MNEFFTWAFLGTFAGCVLGVTILTQFIKGVPFINKIPTQFVSWIIAAVILAIVTAISGDGALPWHEWAMVPLNAVLVSLSANGAFEGVQRITGMKDHPPDGK